jgi:integrase/recombinase XerC
MARKPSPWYWPERRGWYTILNGQRRRLIDLAPDAPEPKKRGSKWIVPPEVDQAFHALMIQPDEQSQPVAPSGLSVVEVFDKFLAWSQKHNAPRTYEWYRDHIQDFINHTAAVVRQPYTELKKFHVTEWVDSHGEAWSPAYRRGAIIAIQRPFNWAEELDYIPASPIKRIKKPEAQRREQYVSPDEWPKIRDHYAEGDPFRDLLEVAWETGCRPQEVKWLEPRHVQMDKRLIFIPKEEAKGKKHPRVIYLSDRAEQIIARHLEQHPEGLIFRNEDGEPWTRHAMSCRFDRLKKHLGVKYCGYDLRHGFGTRKLVDGHNPSVVAEAMGHRDGRMLAKHYAHLDQEGDHVRKVVEERAKKNGKQE